MTGGCDGACAVFSNVLLFLDGTSDDSYNRLVVDGSKNMVGGSCVCCMKPRGRGWNGGVTLLPLILSERFRGGIK